jgi:predicted transposase/invertase (TIGR01784 family)
METSDIIIKPTSDLFIAALWSAPKNEPILRSLINSVMTDIGLPAVCKTTVLNPFNIQEFPVDKQIRLDVRVEDETGALYDVEVQTDSHPAFFERILQYWAETYSSQMHRGDDYVKLRPVRSIVITEFPVFEPLQKLHTVFEARSRENPAVLLSDHFQIHFLRLGNLLQNEMAGLEPLSDDLQKWLEFWALGDKLSEDKMSTILQDSPVMAAYQEYKRFSADPMMRERERDRQRFLRDQRQNTAYAHAEGLEKGLAQGKAEGLAEGEARGKAQRSLAIARNMKAEGLPVALIVKMTGLSPLEIENLR